MGTVLYQGFSLWQRLQWEDDGDVGTSVNSSDLSVQPDATKFPSNVKMYPSFSNIHKILSPKLANILNITDLPLSIEFPS